MTDDHYQPIACGDYDIYEIAIMQNRNLELEYLRSTGEQQRQKVKPLELKIADGAEYLVCCPVVDGSSTEPESQQIRLDKISRAVILDN